MENKDKIEQSKTRKGPVKNKNAKLPSPKGVHTSSVKKSKDGKDGEAASSVSNGISALDSHPKQPVKNRSFNDKQTRLSKVNFVVKIILLPRFLFYHFYFGY